MYQYQVHVLYNAYHVSYLTPAVGCVVIMATVCPFQVRAQTRHQIPDCPGDLKLNLDHGRWCQAQGMV